MFQFPSNPVYTSSPNILTDSPTGVFLPNNTFANKQVPLFIPVSGISTLTVSSIFSSSVSTGSATIQDLSGAVSFISSLTVNSFVCNNSSIVEDIEVSSLNALAINTSSIYGLSGEISTIRTNKIVWGEDDIVMLAEEIPGPGGPAYELSLNGQVIVTTSTLVSSINEWAKFPADSTIRMTGNGIIDLAFVNMADLTTPGVFGTISSVGNIIGSNTGVLTGFLTVRGQNLSGSTCSVSSIVNNTLSSNTILGNFANISTLSSNTILGNSANLSTLSTNSLITNTAIINTLSTNTFSANVANFSTTITGPNINTNTITANKLQSYNSSSLAISSYFQLNQQAGTSVNIEANQGINIAGYSDVNITGKNGNRGRVYITGDSGYLNGIGGEVYINANAGDTSITGIGTGGLIELNAYSPLVVSSFTSAIKLSAAGINSYAGAIPSFGSLAGYNFIYGQGGVSIVAGVLPSLFPSFPLTCYLHGDLGVTTDSEFYCPEIYPYWNGLTTPPDLMIAGRYIIPNLATVYVQLSTVKSIEMAGSALIDEVRTINGDDLQITNVSTINGVVYPPPVSFISSFNTLATSSFTVSSINGGSYLSTVVSSFQTASISSLSLSTINNMAKFGTKSMVIEGDVAQIQLANTAGQFTKLNLLSRQNFSEIQSFDSTFTTPLNLIFTADNFGFNTDNVTGGIEMDISGNTQVQGDFFVTQNTQTSSIVTSSLQIIAQLNGKPYPLFAEFIATSSITVSASDTPTVIPLDTTNYVNGVTLNAGAIQFDYSGLYEIKATLQLDKSGGGTDPCDIWMRLNNADIAYSGNQVTVQGNVGEICVSLMWYVNAMANDKLEFYFASNDNTMTATAFPAWTDPPNPYDRPAIPSLRVNVTAIK